MSLAATSGGDVTFHFCTSNNDCPSNSFCGVIICVPLGVFSDIIQAISTVYDTVRVGV